MKFLLPIRFEIIFYMFLGIFKKIYAIDSKFQPKMFSIINLYIF